MDPLKQCAQLAGWPENPKDLGRQRVLALWSFFTQPFDFDRGRAAAFQELQDLLSSEEAETWDEAEWREVVEGMRHGSAAEMILVSEAMQKKFAGRPEVFVRLSRALYSAQEDSARPTTSVPEISGSESSLRSKKTPGEAEASTSSVGQNGKAKPAVVNRKTSTVPSGQATGLGGRKRPNSVGTPNPTPAPLVAKSTVCDARGDVQKKSGETPNNDLSQRKQVSKSRSEPASPPVPSKHVQDIVVQCKRKSPEAEKDQVPSSGVKRKQTAAATVQELDKRIDRLQVLERGREEESDAAPIKKKPVHATLISRPSLSVPFVVKLAANDFTTAGMQDGCIPVDILKWEKIVQSCIENSVILLPEGTFSFPDGYCLKAETPGLNISGSDRDKTILRCHPKSGRNDDRKTKLVLRSTSVIALKIESTLHLENLSIKRASSKNFSWAKVMFVGKNCRVTNVTFFGCGLEMFYPLGNVVKSCKFFGGVSSEDPNFDLQPTAIELERSWGGNTIKDIFIQDVFYGVHKSAQIFSKADSISDIVCHNVRIGVCLNNCKGDSVNNLRYRWTFDNKLETTRNRGYPTALEIFAGSKNEVDGINCKGKGSNFCAFILRRSENAAPRWNVIRNVKGAQGCYVDEGNFNEISNVDN